MKKFFQGFIYAAKGIVTACREQRNVKFQVAVGIMVTLAGIYFKITATEWCIVLITIGLVISLELINTALESFVDMVSPERNPLAGKIKDIAAGAVLVMAALSVIIGLLIFWKYLFP